MAARGPCTQKSGILAKTPMAQLLASGRARLQLGNVVPLQAALGQPGAGPRPEKALLAVSLVGMAQVSARFWLDTGNTLSESVAAELIAGLAWRGISGYPLEGGLEDGQ